MTKLDEAVRPVINKVPTYMRPPLYSTSDVVLNVMGRMGYKVVQGDIDTNDWKNDFEASKKFFTDGLAAGSRLVLVHDGVMTPQHEAPMKQLVEFMIAEIKTQNLKGMIKWIPLD